MESWWQEISVLNKAFAISAVAFTALFLWQIILIVFGMDSGGHDHVGGGGVDHGGLDHDADGGGTHGNGHGAEAVTFTVVSVRSLSAFGMLFSWAGSLYLAGGTSPVLAIIYSILWGLVAMFSVSGALYFLLRQQERGNASIWSAIGEEGSVYMNIPEGGVGKIRVMVSGAISFVNARSRDRAALAAGTKVRVVGVVDDTMVEVEGMPDPEGM
jgi:membrane protein implicated in regulation of membrane protease activity